MADFLRVASDKAGPSTDTVTTPGKDTTGADLILVNVPRTSPGVLSDNKGNTIPDPFVPPPVAGSLTHEIYVLERPTVGAGHTFTYTGTGIQGSIQVLAVSGSLLVGSTVDQTSQISSGSGSSGLNLSAPELLPSGDDYFFVTFTAYLAGNGQVVSDPFTIAEQVNGSGVGYGGAIAYQIQELAEAETPVWSYNSSHNATIVNAVFIVGGGRPVNTVAPTITGNAVTGQTLTKHSGTWTGADTVAGQWQRNTVPGGTAFVAIPGETGSTYVLTLADVLHSVRYLESATNGNGTASKGSAGSAAVGTSIGMVTIRMELQTDIAIELPTFAPGDSGGLIALALLLLRKV